MGIPVGDILRAFVKGGVFRKILDALKGTKITTPGGTEILLDENGNEIGGGKVYGSGKSPFDSIPHKPGPTINFGGPRR